MLSWSILQYFWPGLSENRSWKPILVFFLRGCLRQVLLYSILDQGWHHITRLGNMVPTHKTRVYPGWAIWSYYPLGQYAGFMNFWSWKFLVFSLMIDKSVEMILYSHILISLNGNSEIVIKIWVSTLTSKYVLHIFSRYRQVSFQLCLIIII